MFLHRSKCPMGRRIFVGNCNLFLSSFALGVETARVHLFTPLLLPETEDIFQNPLKRVHFFFSFFVIKEKEGKDEIH